MVTQLPSSSDLPQVFQLAGYHSYMGHQLRVRGRTIGLLSAYRKSENDFSVNAVSLMTALEQLGIVIENHRLQVQIRDAAVESERQRLRYELHDSITQSLYALTLFARVGRYALEDGDIPRLSESLLRLETGANAIHKELRLLLFQLQPFTLADLSLREAIESRFESLERKLGIKTVVDVTGEADLSEEIKFELYRISMEALNNSLKHANATSVSVVLNQSKTDHFLIISDDGVGFDLGNARAGMGLRHIAERAKSFDGLLSIDSRPEAGTMITVRVPKTTGQREFPER